MIILYLAYKMYTFVCMRTGRNCSFLSVNTNAVDVCKGYKYIYLTV